MRRGARSILAAGGLLLSGITAAPGASAETAAGNSPASAADTLKVFDAEVTAEQVPLLLAAGQDAHELGESVPPGGRAKVQLFLTDDQARDLGTKGVEVTERTVSPQAESRLKAAGDGVYRPYSGPGNLQEEIRETAAAHPGLTKVVSIGRTVQGKDILALKLTKGAARSKDGARPSVLYMSNQHAREWITPEMTRRLMHHYLDNYGKDRRITKIVDSTELWFVLSANPDGYDWTHAADANRLWRKNLRDVNGDGVISRGDGIDLNRNFTYKWGYDNEGSSPQSTGETYRGASPGSEPETRAIDSLQKRIGFDYGINYHSAAELLLYGVGWQVATPTPDDVLYRSLAGTPENSAVPGYYPQVSSELYTTNGEADGHGANVNGIMMFTPEMTTCETVSDSIPDDAWEADDCRSGFNFPDDEKLIQAEFAKNIPFALSVAETASHPDQPSSPVGLSAPDFTPDTFTTSYGRGADQEVAVTARKSVRDKELNYRINGGRTHDEKLRAWKGGETYGGEDNLHFDEYRAEVEDADAGDRVEVWFTGRTKSGKRTTSDRFTYTVAERPRADTLVVAEEGAPAQYAQAYVDALRANGLNAAVWDVAEQGAPHHLGVLSHFSTVVHHTGAAAPGGDTQLAVRDFLNEGGKLIEAGEQAGGNAQVGRTRTNDFSQYYLGAYGRTSTAGATAFTGAGALLGTSGPLGAAPGNPLDQAGTYTVTSSVLAPDLFPHFAGAAAGTYDTGTGAAAVTTKDTVLLGFGLEQITDAERRAALLGKALRALRD
ncbi:zinc carboxypeptidase [Streptomyces sp. IB2014 016-6]|nr:zinc carboxypeptidase [Streptomyces sp. IB2014 016-6]